MASAQPAAPVRSGYQHVQETIRRRIRSGEWRPGCKIPSERELEKEFSLNRLTISKGLANLAAEGLLVRRRGQGTFVTERDSGRAAQRRLVKYISPMPFSEDVVMRPGVLEGMHEVLAERGYHVGVDFFHDADEMVKRLQGDSDGYHAGFAIWYDPSEAVDAELARLSDEGYPFVLLDAVPTGFEGDCVVTDNVEGSLIVVRHLVEAGHRQIAYVTRRVNRTSLEERLTGFLRGMVTCDCPIHTNSVFKLKGVREEARGEIDGVIDRLIDDPTPPTAVLFSNEDLAVAAIERLWSRGLRVPDDVSVVSNDNLDVAKSPRVAMTTVVQNWFEMGKVAAEILLDRLTNPHSRPTQVQLHPRFIERASVATRKGDF